MKDSEPLILEPPGEITLRSVLRALKHYRVTVIATTLAAILLVGGYTLAKPARYTATASFLPQAKKSSSAVSGLAAQLGVTAPGAEPGQSPAFYIELLRSRAVLRPVVEKKYGDRTLIEQLSDENDPDRAREEAIERLRDMISVSFSQRTGIVNVGVETSSASRSHAVLRNLIEELNAFNLQNRQTQAAAERKFAQRRLEEVGAELRTAENRLAAFMRTNRRIAQSPGLTFEQDRLMREVVLRQELYATIAQAFEEARMDEVRDTPLITIIEQPELPAAPDPRGLFKKLIIALFAGLALGSFLAVGRAFLRAPEPAP